MENTGQTVRLVSERKQHIPFSPGAVLAILCLVALCAGLIGSGALGVSFSSIFGDAQVGFDTAAPPAHRSIRGLSGPELDAELANRQAERANPLSQLDKLNGGPAAPLGGTLQGGQAPNTTANGEPALQPAPAPAGGPNAAALARAQSASTNQPVISAQQAKQLNTSAEMAANEAISEYQQQQQQAAENAPLVVRNGTVMDARAVATAIGRDPCHVPRANPLTCGNGIPAATPLNRP